MKNICGLFKGKFAVHWPFCNFCIHFDTLKTKQKLIEIDTDGLFTMIARERDQEELA